MGRGAKIRGCLFLLILAIMPFGQLPGVFLQSLLNLGFRLHPIDILTVFTVIFTLIVKGLRGVSDYLKPAFAAMAFSLGLSVFVGNFDPYGFLYFVRLFFYLLFFVTLPSFHVKDKNLLVKSLILVGVSISVLGWIQYLLIPDLTSLKQFGWDDHYFRLTSSFLDPTFTGILLAFSVLAAVYFFDSTKKLPAVAAFVFLLFTLTYTYSRASFLAVLVGLFAFLWRRQKRLFLSIALLFVFFVVLLPNSSGGEGVNLGRTNSINQKFENYIQGLRLVSSSPVFGLGYNNICKAKADLGFNVSVQKNSCYGLDNSFLLILASTGALGLFVALEFFRKLGQATSDDAYGRLFKSTVAATFVHSFFTNTLFYPWVIVWLAVLALISRRIVKS